MFNEKWVVVDRKTGEKHRHYSIVQGDYFTLTCVEKGPEKFFSGFNFKLGSTNGTVEYELAFKDAGNGKFIAAFESVITNQWAVGDHQYEIEAVYPDGNKVSCEKYILTVKEQIGED